MGKPRHSHGATAPHGEQPCQIPIHFSHQPDPKLSRGQLPKLNEEPFLFSHIRPYIGKEKNKGKNTKGDSTAFTFHHFSFHGMNLHTDITTSSLDIPALLWNKAF